jgi:hypothetical protein
VTQRPALAAAIVAMTLLGCLARAAEPGQATRPEQTAAPGQAAAPERSTTPEHTTASEPAAYSAAGLYNLGNSYARAGKPGMAVLNYERASLLAPDDPDIETNLRFVRNSAHLPPESSNAIERYVKRIDPTLLAWAGVLGVLLAGVSLIAGRLSGRKTAGDHSGGRRTDTRRIGARRGLRRAALLVGVALMGVTVGQAVVLWPRLHAAVVVTDAAPVRVSPVPMGDLLFTLPEAETVKVSAEHEGFVLIRTRTGRTGWVSRSNVVPVLPRR